MKARGTAGRSRAVSRPTDAGPEHGPLHHGAGGVTPSGRLRAADAPPDPPSTAVITCAVLEDEMAAFGADLAHVVHVTTLRQGLHNTPDTLRDELQAAIDRIEVSTDAEAIVLGYGLCSRGIEGLRTTRCRLVVPRAHDCITLLLGDKERYARYVAENPGTYWYSVGWNRHANMPGKERYERQLREYRERYGEDNAAYLMETEQHWFQTYRRATFVELTVSAAEQGAAYTKQCADWLGWEFDHQQGDPVLLRTLLSGPWDAERFLVLAPGQTPSLTADERIIEARPAEEFDEDDDAPERDIGR